MRSKPVPIIVAAAVAAALTACGAGSSGATKAGGSGHATVTLRMVTDDYAGKPASDQIVAFARRVDTLSDGALKIKAVFHAAGDGPDWDQRNLRLVSTGDAEMGLIPTRSFDTEGVTSLRALNAPFLLDSDALVDKVVTSDLVDEMLAGLKPAGVVGLALLPDALRHPFGHKGPLLGPDDYRGKRLRSPTSKTMAALFTALGAATSDDEFDPETMAGMESGYPQLADGTATGNVTFTAKVNALIVNAGAYRRLDDAQRKVLTDAADQTRTQVIADRPTDAELSARYCQEGKSVALASDAEVRALERSAAGVFADLDQDPFTARAIDRIQSMKASTTAGPPARACGKRRAPAIAVDADKATRIDGVYRFELTHSIMRKHDVKSEDAENNLGVLTYRFSRGKVCYHQDSPVPTNNSDGCDRYTVRANVLTYRFEDGTSEEYTFSVRPGGDLKLAVKRVTPEFTAVMNAYFDPVWKRIGDVK